MRKIIKVEINPKGKVCMFCKLHSYTGYDAICHAYDESLRIERDYKGNFKHLIFRCDKCLKENKEGENK